MSKSIVQVLPLRRFPRSKGVFDYELPQQITAQPGDLVEVSFKNSLCPALVISRGQSSVRVKKLKSVSRLLVSGYNNQTQLKLIQWLAQYSGVSLALVAKLNAPFLPNRRFSIDPGRMSRIKETKKLNKPVSIVTNSYIKKVNVTKSLIDKVISRKEQVLLLVPEVSRIKLWREELKNKYSIAVYTGQEETSDKRLVWLNTRMGKAQIIIGTRRALWLNYYNLGGIIVDEAENENYFQAEQNPRYDSLLIARQISNFSSAALALISTSPRLENWYAARRNNQEAWHDLSQRIGSAELIDLRVAVKFDNSKLVNQNLVKSINDTLKKNKKVLLYLNRRGNATGSICTDCGYTAACPQCQRRMVVNKDESALICYHCGITKALAIPCPICGGTKVNYQGVGIDQLAKQIKKIWPKEKTGVIQDKFDDSQTKLVAESSIIIGSRTAIRACQSYKLGLIVLVNIDSELNLPEFRSSENVWQLVNNLLPQTDKIIIQTYQPSHYIWQSILNSDFDYFYKTELNIRKQYSYPPFVQLIRFTTEADNNDAALKQAHKLKDLLIKELSGTGEIVGPYPDYFQHNGKKWGYHILVKLPLNFNPSKLWGSLPEDIIIDRNPWFILS